MQASRLAIPSAQVGEVGTAPLDDLGEILIRCDPSVALDIVQQFDQAAVVRRLGHRDLDASVPSHYAANLSLCRSHSTLLSVNSVAD